MKALKRARMDRYQTVKELQQEIAAYQSGFATKAENASLFKQMILLHKRHKAESVLLAGSVAVLVAVVTGFVIKVSTEKNRAEANLVALKKTAPTFCAEAIRFLGENQLEEALKHITQAATLVPENADYHYLKGNVCEALLRLRDARTAYAVALDRNPGHALAAANLKLCQKILQDSPGDDPLKPASLYELYALMRQQERFAEARAMMQRLGKQLAYSTAREQLDEAGVQGTVTADDDGLLRVHLSNTAIEDLSPLRGLSIKDLRLSDTAVHDLSPLQGMPLTLLHLGRTQVNDLTPLRGMKLADLEIYATANGQGVTDLGPLQGMPLVRLNMANNDIRDLSPLRGMPLEFLDMDALPASDLSALRGMPLNTLRLCKTPITDLTPLRGLPLRNLALADCLKLTDLTPLAECKDLESLLVPAQCKDLSAIRHLPKLKWISSSQARWDDKLARPAQTAAEFWKEYDAQKKSGK